MLTRTVRPARLAALLVAGLLAGESAAAQIPDWLFPDRALVPELLAGPRDPVNKGALLFVPREPSASGARLSAEVAVAGSLPLLRLFDGHGPLVLAASGAAFARFTPYTTILELVNTDWFFAVPVIWHIGDDWLRLRYVHTSSHLGDEYALRFDGQGINFSRDGVELMGRIQRSGLGVYAGARYDVNVHPEDSERWVGRAGAELLFPDADGVWQPYLALDIQGEKDVGWSPRITAQAGLWLLPVGGGQRMRLAAEVLTGPTPLGQFQGRGATQLGIALLLSP